MEKINLLQGNNIELLKGLPENSVDSIVTDPPYGISFMGRKWDYDVPSVEFWKEVLRVLKPGGHVLSFGGTRTYHRMVVNMEDAGFEIRDQIMWLYGSGFPKSLNIGKAVDKLQGNEREVVGDNPNHRTTTGLLELGFQDGKESSSITKGNSDWEGWGTALKPANEPICLARKPLSEKTIAENVLKWKTGGINIDGCRVGTEVRTTPVGSNDSRDDKTLFGLNSTIHHKREETTEGRFPANILLDEEAGRVLGEPSRFFYVAKVSKKERNLGIDKNNHPTVKPINLMTYLVRLITPPNGIVLDPFMGSGSTGVAAQLEGFNFIGMEMDGDYFKIAQNRINNWEEYKKIIK